MSTPYNNGESYAMVSPYFLGKRRKVTSNVPGGPPVIGLTNPLVTTLDAAGNDFKNVDEVNGTQEAKYFDLGAISPPNKYEVVAITDELNAVGELVFHLRCLDAGFRQLIRVQISSVPGKTNIQILNHLHESDNLCITEVGYGVDSANRGVVYFTCGTPSTTCEVTFYENQKNQSFASQIFDINGFAGSPVAISNVYDVFPLSAFLSGTTGNFTVRQRTTTKNLNTNSISPNTTSEVNITSDVNLLNNDISDITTTTSNNVKTNQITAISGDVVINSNVDMKNNRLVNSINDYLYVDENLDILNHGIVNVSSINGQSSEIDIFKDLDMNNNNVVNADNVELNSVSRPTGTIQINNPVSLGNNSIQTSSIASQPNDLTNKNYVDSLVASAGAVTNPMTSNLDAGSFKISNLGTALNNDEAVNKGQMDTAINTAIPAALWQSSVANKINSVSGYDVGIGITNPQYKLHVVGDVNATSVEAKEVTASVIQSKGAMTITNVPNGSTGLGDFSAFPYSGFSGKRLATFSYKFGKGGNIVGFSIPDALFHPNSATFIKGGGALKIKLTCMSYDENVGIINGGIEYKEYALLFVPAGVGGGTPSTFLHTLHDVNVAPGGGAFTSYLQLVGTKIDNITNPGTNPIVNHDVAYGINVSADPALVPGVGGGNRLFIRGSFEVL